MPREGNQERRSWESTPPGEMLCSQDYLPQGFVPVPNNGVKDQSVHCMVQDELTQNRFLNEGREKYSI